MEGNSGADLYQSLVENFYYGILFIQAVLLSAQASEPSNTIGIVRS